MEDVMIEEQEQYEEQERLRDDPFAIVRVTSRCQLIDLSEEEVWT